MTGINHLDVRPTLTFAFDSCPDATSAAKAVKLEWTEPHQRPPVWPNDRKFQKPASFSN